jgi:hypothetical protein
VVKLFAAVLSEYMFKLLRRPVNIGIPVGGKYVIADPNDSAH